MRSILTWSALIVAAAAFGCASVDYHPAHYPIREAQIEPVDFDGPISIVNALEPDGEPVVLWEGGRQQVLAPRNRIGDHVAALLRDELERRGVRVTADAATRLSITIDEFNARNQGFVIRGTSVVRVVGGEEFEKRLEIVNNSPGNVYRALNGTLARVVITVLNDPDVRTYLAAGG